MPSFISDHDVKPMVQSTQDLTNGGVAEQLPAGQRQRQQQPVRQQQQLPVGQQQQQPVRQEQQPVRQEQPPAMQQPPARQQQQLPAGQQQQPPAMQQQPTMQLPAELKPTLSNSTPKCTTLLRSYHRYTSPRNTTTSTQAPFLGGGIMYQHSTPMLCATVRRKGPKSTVRLRSKDRPVKRSILVSSPRRSRVLRKHVRFVNTEVQVIEFERMTEYSEDSSSWLDNLTTVSSDEDDDLIFADNRFAQVCLTEKLAHLEDREGREEAVADLLLQFR